MDFAFTFDEYRDADLDLDAVTYDLSTAIEMSIGTDAQCSPDELPAGESDRRGFWADGSMGSLGWLDDRSGITGDLIKRIDEHNIQALQWLVDCGAAKRVTSTSVRTGTVSIKTEITIEKPDGDIHRWSRVWDRR